MTKCQYKMQKIL